MGLQFGFQMLRKNAVQAEEGAEIAHKAERKVEKAYRKALVELFDAEGSMERLNDKDKDSGAVLDARLLQEVMDRLKRREIYRHMSNAADRMARAGNTLHDIVVKIT